MAELALTIIGLPALVFVLYAYWRWYVLGKRWHVNDRR
jgi:hypothetical protein